MLTHDPFITLLTPCFNAAEFLPRLAEQVRAQTRPFAALIAYDDGSTDDSMQVAANLGWQVLGPNPNRGVAHARNRLAAAVATEWFHFHDADDLIDPQFVERLAAHCGAEADVVSCDADWVSDPGREMLLQWRYEPQALAADPYRHLLSHPMSLNNTVIRTSLWRRIGGCDESLAMWEDADVHARLAYAGARWRHLPEVRTVALRREASFSHDYRKNGLCRLQVLEKYAAEHPGRSADVLAAEAERCAGGLALLGETAGARRALRLCRRLGGDPPTTDQPLIRLLKPFVPDLTLVRWQARRRDRAKRAEGG